MSLAIVIDFGDDHLTRFGSVRKRAGFYWQACFFLPGMLTPRLLWNLELPRATTGHHLPDESRVKVDSEISDLAY